MTVEIDERSAQITNAESCNWKGGSSSLVQGEYERYLLTLKVDGCRIQQRIGD